MKIILDSNIIIKDFHFLSLDYVLLKQFLARSRSKIVVPSLVLEEVVNRYKELLLEACSRVESAHRKLNGLLNDRPPKQSLVDIERAVATYGRLLRSKLKEFQVEYLEHQEIPHNKLVKRDLARKKPFSKSGRGYRDALIWESILEFLATASGKIVFITNDPNDFFDKDKQGLHSDLKSDLLILGMPHNRIELFVGLHEFIEKHIKPYLPLVEKIKLELEQNAYGDLDILKFLDQHKKQIADEIEPYLEVSLSHFKIENPTIPHMEYPEKLEVLEVHELKNSEILIEFGVEYLLNVDFFIFKSDYYTLSEGKADALSILDSDWNKHYMWGAIDVETNISFAMIFNLKQKTVSNYELVDIRLKEELDVF